MLHSETKCCIWMFWFMRCKFGTQWAVFWHKSNNLPTKEHYFSNAVAIDNVNKLSVSYQWTVIDTKITEYDKDVQ